MATASVDRGMLWTDLEGRELPGGWRLKRLARPEGRNAWFEGVGPDGKPAMVSLTEALNDEEELMARLRAAAEIRDPHVVAVREARRVWVDETPVVMAAMEPTDENLADVLRERALEAAEAQQLLGALLHGLAAIHARRLVHGRMEAGSVLAMGDTVKLRSDCLHLEGFATGAGEDVRGAGRIVVQALTRRIPAGEHDPLLQLVPEPMGRAVRRALSGNATVGEVAALAGVRMVQAKEPAAVRSSPEAKRMGATPVAEMPKPTDVESARGGSGRAAETRTVAVPAMRAVENAADAKCVVQMDLPLIPRRKEDCDDEEEDSAGWVNWGKELLGKGKGLLGRWNYHRSGAPWVIGAAVGLALATALMLHGWLHRGAAAKATPAGPRIVVERAAPAAARKHAASTGPVSATQVWRVVVYTYRQRSAAEQRARELKQRYPQLQPGVMATRRGDFLVTVGGAMTREQAMALRGQALRMGLPRDSYAQNFRQAAST